MDDLSPPPAVLVARLADALLARGEWLALAESCTGGGAACAVTDMAGSSAWFDRGFVTYSNDAKMQMLGVPAQTLQQHGAVSEATALAMARGALAHSRADWALAITGIAGPAGGSPDKPVGTVCFACCARAGSSSVETRRFSGDRQAVRAQSVQHALQCLLQQLQDSPLIV